MAKRLNAGEKIHLMQYRAKVIDGKCKLFKSKITIMGEKVDSEMTMCGTNHSADDINLFLRFRKEFPEKICKRCEKKLKFIVNEAA